MGRLQFFAFFLILTLAAGFRSAGFYSSRAQFSSHLKSTTDSPTGFSDGTTSVTDKIIAFARESFDNLKVSYDILTKRLGEGDSFKQALADALAGPDLDLEAANTKIDEIIRSNGCVVFGWSLSPFSKRAIKYLDSIGVNSKVVELDKPWSEGNPIRAALGRRVGRTSVPFIFICGNYIGGCEDGPTPECPGLVPLALQGKLRPMLIEAGTLTPHEDVDYAPGYARRSLLESVSGAKENVYGVIDKSAVIGVGFDISPEAEGECPSDNECELP